MQFKTSFRSSVTSLQHCYCLCQPDRNSCLSSSQLITRNIGSFFISGVRAEAIFKLARTRSIGAPTKGGPSPLGRGAISLSNTKTYSLVKYLP